MCSEKKGSMAFQGYKFCICCTESVNSCMLDCLWLISSCFNGGLTSVKLRWREMNALWSISAVNCERNWLDLVQQKIEQGKSQNPWAVPMNSTFATNQSHHWELKLQGGHCQSKELLKAGWACDVRPSGGMEKNSRHPAMSSHLAATFLPECHCSTWKKKHLINIFGSDHFETHLFSATLHLLINYNNNHLSDNTPLGV